jgi:hypothetical protein
MGMQTTPSYVFYIPWQLSIFRATHRGFCVLDEHDVKVTYLTSSAGRLPKQVLSEIYHLTGYRKWLPIDRTGCEYYYYPMNAMRQEWQQAATFG